jgi:hypothetical protein
MWPNYSSIPFKARRQILIVLCITWTIAFWLALHAGLALIVDPKTGAKHCIERLGSYLGLDEGNALAPPLAGVSVLLTLALPLLISGMIVVPYIARWRARTRAKK